MISKAVALYNMGEFEASLIQFERGWRVRQGPRMKSGLLQCKNAILNAVGQNAKGFDKDLIAKMIKEQEKQKQKEKLKADQKGGLNGSKTRSQLKKEKKKYEKIQKTQDKVLLGKVASDATFLRDFLEPSVKVDKMSTEQVTKLQMYLCNQCHVSYFQRRAIEIATDALEYLEKRKTFWQQTAMCST